MARYVKSGTVNTVQEINSELEKIATAQDEFLTRNGEAPNEMKANLDMNSNRITNLPAPESPNEPLRLADLDESLYVLVAGDTMEGPLSGPDSTNSTEYMPQLQVANLIDSRIQSTPTNNPDNFQDYGLVTEVVGDVLDYGSI